MISSAVPVCCMIKEDIYRLEATLEQTAQMFPNAFTASIFCGRSTGLELIERMPICVKKVPEVIS